MKTTIVGLATSAGEIVVNYAGWHALSAGEGRGSQCLALPTPFALLRACHPKGDFFRPLALAILALLIAGVDGTAAEPESLRLTKLSETVSAHGGVLSPDGKTVAANVYEPYQKKLANGQAVNAVVTRTKLLDAATGKLLAAIIGAHAVQFSSTGNVLGVKQTFDEQYLKAGQLGLHLTIPMPQLWDVSHPQKPRQLFVVDSASEQQFSPSGKMLAVIAGPEDKAGNSGKVVIGLPKRANKGGPAVPGIGLGVLGGGAGMTAQYVETWEVDAARLQSRYAPGPKDQVILAHPVFSPDGKQLAVLLTRAGGQQIVLYDIAKKKEARLIDLGANRVHTIPRSAPNLAMPAGAVMPVNAMMPFGAAEPMLDFSPQRSHAESDGYVLAAVVQNKEGVALNLWKPASGELLATLLSAKNEDNTTPQIEFCFSPDGKTMAATVTRWKLPAGNQGAVPKRVGFGFGVPFPGGGAVPQGGAAPGVVPPAGPLVPGIGPRELAGAEVALWDVGTRTRKLTLKVAAHTARFASDAIVATISTEGNGSKLRLWDVATGRELAALEDCNSMQFATDGRTLLTTGGPVNAPAMRVWRVSAVGK